MCKTKQNSIRTTFAWIIGILVWVFSQEGASSIMHELGIPLAVAQYAILIPCLFVGARVGMAIKTGKLNGGVSKERNIIFLRYFSFFLVMGGIFIVVEMLLDMTPLPKGNPLLSLIIDLIFYGIGALVFVKMGLINTVTNHGEF